MLLADVPIRSLEPVPSTAPPAQPEDLPLPPGYRGPGQAGSGRDLLATGHTSPGPPGALPRAPELGDKPLQQAVKIETHATSAAEHGHVLNEVQGPSRPLQHTEGVRDRGLLGNPPSSPHPVVSREADPSGSEGPPRDKRGPVEREREPSAGDVVSGAAGVTWRSPVGALQCELPAGAQIEDCVLFWLGRRAPCHPAPPPA